MIEQKKREWTLMMNISRSQEKIGWEEQRSRRRKVDEFELKSKAGEDKRKGERLRRYEDDEFQPKSREVRHREEKWSETMVNKARL
ncbi:zinc finger CCCH domain-containing protein 25 isoform X1 [Prunus yedoensis var. nudiflora]|uniref:Zinc finger CCCH domain-containing protein 25 isoform X1 n=1 Tax=Prunus yedoensis var. nudiflora TaxID=2094558 RepID=A0A314UJS9_PRUYE|nr:zinc finger CCCH domain-containing protein 25 isoform X1 [Prunus yedoensis var. nudiflora]